MKAKRLLSALLAIAVVCSSMIFSSTTFAESQEPEIFATIGFEAPDYAKDAQIHTIQGWTLSTSFPGYLTTGAYVRDAAALEGKGLSPLSGEQSLLFEKILDAAISLLCGVRGAVFLQPLREFRPPDPGRGRRKIPDRPAAENQRRHPLLFQFPAERLREATPSAPFDAAPRRRPTAPSLRRPAALDLSFHIDARTVDTTVSNVTTGQSWIKSTTSLRWIPMQRSPS